MNNKKDCFIQNELRDIFQQYLDNITYELQEGYITVFLKANLPDRKQPDRLRYNFNHACSIPMLSLESPLKFILIVKEIIYRFNKHSNLKRIKTCFFPKEIIIVHNQSEYWFSQDFINSVASRILHTLIRFEHRYFLRIENVADMGEHPIENYW